jgi:putative radical SAM enzyme (TIGR03279 family)
MAKRRYGEVASGGGRISSIEADSDAERAGLAPGDLVRAVGGEPVRDVIDWQWLTEAIPFAVTVVRDGVEHRVSVDRSWTGPLGVTFDEVIFDGIRECVNACEFCFVSQLPPGLRPRLSVRDDDYRLSFLTGNFVTLTNLEEADMRRIVDQRLSPLHVSVHAADPAVRSRLVCCTTEDTTLERLESLLAAGIQAHIQIVAVPGVNDDRVLDDTLGWLAAREGVLSVGVVPLGFTAYQRRYERSFLPEESACLIEVVERRQAAQRAARGSGWVYAADEFYLSAGVVPPGGTDYDDYPQYENGIGMVRAFLEELEEAVNAAHARGDLSRPLAHTTAGEDVVPALTAVTGTLFAPVLQSALASAGLRGRVRVMPVANALFGGNVSVSGLLSGDDIVSAIEADGARGTYLIPDVVVNSDGLLLDDVPADELSARSRADVRVIAANAASLVDAVRVKG